MSEIEGPDHRQSVDPDYNREGGIVVTPGSAHQREMAKFEQLPHSKWAFGNPGNPYKFRRWPADMYIARRRSGKVACIEPDPQPYEFQHERNYVQALEATKQFNLASVRRVNSQEEWARAMEEGFRDGPDIAIQAFIERENSVSQVIAHGNYEDRGMSAAALAEKAAQELANGNVPLAEVKRTPVRRIKKVRTA